MNDFKCESPGVLRNFLSLCAIPRGSGNCEKVAEFLKSFGEKLGLEAFRDEHNNVIIKKPATSSLENSPTVVLQAHIDMVCEAEVDKKINFLTDPIAPVFDGDFITADGTTLGADNGIGVAMIMSVLEDKELCHPSIEALFTSDEETGMFGAEGLDPALISGRRLINLDSSDEGVFTVSCAGGARAEITLPVKVEQTEAHGFRLTFSGLCGGHSGVDINLGRHNSNILALQFLKILPDGFRLISLGGGNRDNVIPSFTECEISANLKKDFLEQLAADFVKAHFTSADPNFEITVTEIKTDRPALSHESTATVLELLKSLPNGVVSMSPNFENLVETSLNLGVLHCGFEGLVARFSVRSSAISAKAELLERLELIAQSFGASFSVDGHYPAWEYRENSPLREICVNRFTEIYGRPPVVEAVHAGLECGILSEKLAGLDAISFGPDIFDFHTVGERVSIPSAIRTYRLLTEILKSNTERIDKNASLNFN